MADERAPEREIGRRGFESFAKGDLAALREWMTDEVVWHEPGRSPLGGDYKGPSGVLELLEKLRERSNGEPGTSGGDSRGDRPSR